MDCEICGIEIHYQPKRVVVDGVQLLVCFECAALGEAYWKPAEPSTSRQALPLWRPVKVKTQKKGIIDKSFEDVELIEDWASKIRKTRIRCNLTQEELANLAKEKLSIIQKIETGKMSPNIKLCKTLEHILKIKLLAEPDTKEVKVKTTNLSELTLGDIVHLKKKNQE